MLQALLDKPPAPEDALPAIRRHAVRIAGAGRPLVFSHGYGCDQNVWRAVAPAFVHDHRVVLFDHAGCGSAAADSYDLQRHATLHGHAGDIVDVCQAACQAPCVLVAHSVNAMSAILAAKARPDLFEALVLVGLSPSYLNLEGYRGGFEREDIDGLLEMIDANHFAWAGMMAPVIMGNAERPELASELGASFCRMDSAIARHFARTTFLSDHRADIAGLTLSMLLLHCTDDALVPPEVRDDLAARLPHAKHVTMAATGHCPHMSEPAETIRVLRGFLDGLPSIPAQP